MSLFWRTFLLVGALLGTTLSAALFTFATLEEGPRAQRVGLQVASLVNLTRTALVSSQTVRRIELLDQIARDEGARVRLLEPGDRIEPLKLKPLFEDLLVKRLKELLGATTQFASSLNGEPAFWVSFNIDVDEYWLGIDPVRLLPVRPNFLLLALTVIGIASISAWLLSRIVNKPLQDLGKAVGQLSSGQQPDQLAESGPSELADLNRRFNRLGKDLQALESDRSLALAGISHDIRTPLTRLRLEIELASQLNPADQQSMSDEIDRIDQIVAQFIEYARIDSMQNALPSNSRSSALEHTSLNNSEATEIDLAALVKRIMVPHQLALDQVQVRLAVECPPGNIINAAQIDLERIISNCINNAIRYGARDGVTNILFRVTPAGVGKNSIRGTIEIADDGLGVPKADLERLLRPFARMDSERNTVGGSGLGLAIVERLIRRLGGSVVLKTGAHHNYRGLCVVLTLPQRS
jgi:two-component system, OmpR family, osmolarity sensor histidine kinase EnvZ